MTTGEGNNTLSNKVKEVDLEQFEEKVKKETGEYYLIKTIINRLKSDEITIPDAVEEFRTLFHPNHQYEFIVEFNNLLPEAQRVDTTMEQLVIAAKEGNIEKIRQLPIFETKSELQKTALMLAAQNGHTEIVSLLLERGADINAQMETALMKAAEYGHKETVSLLLERGADVNIKDENGYTALMYGASKGHKEVVSMLLQRGIDIDTNDTNDYTSLMRAVQMNNDVNAKSKIGYTALMKAVEDGHMETVSLLLDRGADVNIHDEWDGYTALMRAAENGDLEIVSLLMIHGADVNVQDKDGSTALMRAVEKNHTEVVSVLLEGGADINAKDKSGSTALILASIYGHKEMVSFLLERGADVYATKQDGYTVVMSATEKGYKEIVSLLSDKELKIPTDWSNFKVLQAVVSSRQLNVVKLCEAKGFPFGRLSQTGQCLLFACADVKYWDEDVWDYLTTKIDVYHLDDMNGSVLYEAVSKGNTALVELLLVKYPDLKDRDERFKKWVQNTLSKEFDVISILDAMNGNIQSVPAIIRGDYMASFRGQESIVMNISAYDDEECSIKTENGYLVIGEDYNRVEYMSSISDKGVYEWRISHVNDSYYYYITHIKTGKYLSKNGDTFFLNLSSSYYLSFQDPKPYWQLIKSGHIAKKLLKFKFAVFGNSGAGKTKLIRELSGGEYSCERDLRTRLVETTYIKTDANGENWRIHDKDGVRDIEVVQERVTNPQHTNRSRVLASKSDNTSNNIAIIANSTPNVPVQAQITTGSRDLSHSHIIDIESFSSLSVLESQLSHNFSNVSNWLLHKINAFNTIISTTDVEEEDVDSKSNRGQHTLQMYDIGGELKYQRFHKPLLSSLNLNCVIIVIDARGDREADLKKWKELVPEGVKLICVCTHSEGLKLGERFLLIDGEKVFYIDFSVDVDRGDGLQSCGNVCKELKNQILECFFYHLN